MAQQSLPLVATMDEAVRAFEQVATLEERQRIAAEMHDGLTQTLSYLHLQVDQVAEQIAAKQNNEALTSLERIRDTLAGAVDEVRANIADLSTSPPRPQALPKLLANTVQEAADSQIAELTVTAAQTPVSADRRGSRGCV